MSHAFARAEKCSEKEYTSLASSYHRKSYPHACKDIIDISTILISSGIKKFLLLPQVGAPEMKGKKILQFHSSYIIILINSKNSFLKFAQTKTTYIKQKVIDKDKMFSRFSSRQRNNLLFHFLPDLSIIACLSSSTYIEPLPKVSITKFYIQSKDSSTLLRSTQYPLANFKQKKLQLCGKKLIMVESIKIHKTYS